MPLMPNSEHSSTMTNQARLQKRIKASLTAVHLSGLPLKAGVEIIIELKEPLSEPLVLVQRRFPIDETPDPDLADEPILSIYANAREGRIVVPLGEIKSMALAAPDDLRERDLPPAAGYLGLRREGGDIVLACPRPRRVKEAERIVEYFQNHIRPADESA